MSERLLLSVVLVRTTVLKWLPWIIWASLELLLSCELSDCLSVINIVYSPGSFHYTLLALVSETATFSNGVDGRGASSDSKPVDYLYSHLTKAASSGV